MKIIIILLSVLLIGCGVPADDPDCSEAISNTLNQYGSPEKVDASDSETFHYHTYHYWCDGIDFMFTWGDERWECKTETREYEPRCN